MKRFLLFLIFCADLCAAQKPNIIFILADDLTEQRDVADKSPAILKKAVRYLNEAHVPDDR